MPTPTERCFLLPQPHPTALQMVPENMRRSAPPQPLALHGSKLSRDQENVFDLNTTHVVRLQLLDRNSGPARGARVVFVSQSEKGSGFEWWSPQAVPDRAGRVVMRLEAGKWFVFVRNTTMMASAGC